MSIIFTIRYLQYAKPSPRIQKLPGLVSESRLTASDDTTNIPLAFRYDGSGTVTLYMYGQGNGNGLTVGYVEGRFIKFGVSTPNQFTFTVDLRELPKGVYISEVKDTYKTHSEKIILR